LERLFPDKSQLPAPSPLKPSPRLELAIETGKSGDRKESTYMVEKAKTELSQSHFLPRRFETQSIGNMGILSRAALLHSES
jgi:hypothetical protein